MRRAPAWVGRILLECRGGSKFEAVGARKQQKSGQVFFFFFRGCTGRPSRSLCPSLSIPFSLISSPYRRRRFVPILSPVFSYPRNEFPSTLHTKEIYPPLSLFALSAIVYISHCHAVQNRDEVINCCTAAERDRNSRLIVRTLRRVPMKHPSARSDFIFSLSLSPIDTSPRWIGSRCSSPELL